MRKNLLSTLPHGGKDSRTGISMGGSPPLMAPSLAFMAGPLSASVTNPPKFSGKIDDWFAFSQDWERHRVLLGIMVAGMELPDYLLL